MAPDLLEHGTERAPRRPRARAVALVLAALAVVGLGALAARGPGPLPEPRALVDRAHVLSVRETLAGALHVRIGVEGVARGRLEQVAVDLPGSAVALLPVPGRLTDEGTGLLVVDVLPRCPEALEGLPRASLTAVVRDPRGQPRRQVEVDLDTTGALSGAVQARCGTVAGVPELRSSPVELDGPVGDPLRTRVDVSAAVSEPVTVVAVRPGPGLGTTVRSALPVTLSPGGTPASVRVDLRLEGCGGSPDTPPYLLVLSTGEAVAASAAPELAAQLADLHPDQCAG